MRTGLVPDEMIINLGLEVVRTELNAQAILDDAACLTALREKLNDFAPQAAGQLQLTRQNAINLLTIISDALNDSMVQLTASGDPIGHNAIDLLRKLIDVLEDLADGKTHAALIASSAGANASLTRAERKYEKILLEAVLIVQRAKGFKTEHQARVFVADRLRRNGRTWRGKPITTGILKQRKNRIKKYK